MRDEATPAAPAGLITVFGGSGFLGRHVVRALAKRGWRVRVAVRRPDLALFLQPLGWVGQIAAVQANLRFPESVAAAIDGADAVVNLVGLGQQRGHQTFAAIHEEGAAAVAVATAAASIPTLVHVSSIGADRHAPSRYMQSKAAGEERVAAAMPEAIIVRPSVIFGPGDVFFTRLGKLIRMGPVVPIFHPRTRLQPVFAGDVAEAIALAVDGRVMPGTVLELGGPDVVTFREAAELAVREAGRRRAIVAVPAGLAAFAGLFLQHLPGRLLTPDAVRQLARDYAVTLEAEAEGRTLAGIGLTPTTMEVVLPTYMAQFRKGGSDPKRVG